MRDTGRDAAAKLDFFISYTAADQDVAVWIAWQLEEAGYTTRNQAWDSRPGNDFVVWMDQAVRDADRILVVLSPDYEQATSFTVPEWTAALGRDPSGRLGVLLPVRVTDFRPGGLFRTRGWIDIAGKDEQGAKAALLAGIQAQRAKPPVEPDYPVRLGHLPAEKSSRDAGVPGPAVDRELQAHWDPRARGVALASDPGWYFTGRSRVLRELVTWLSDPDLDHRPRIVTGGPGSGKSAVLARLVTLADPEVRLRIPPAVLTGALAGTVPPAGIINVAIHARNKTMADVIAALAAATDIGFDGVEPVADPTAATPEQAVSTLVHQLTARPQQRVAVLDALDEATDPELLTTGLLQPLLASAHRSGLRLLVGTRRPLIHAFGPRIVVLDLDDPAFLDEADLTDYVARVLLAEDEPRQPTPYRGHRELAEQVAWAVARRAIPTFLIARIVARSLVIADQPLDTTQPGWELHLPATVGQAFEGYLERFDADQDRARDLLTPLAFAEGVGLPREELWAPLARVLSGNDAYTDDDVDWVQHAAAAYLIEDRDQGRSVYRLYHEALAEHLRSQYPGPEPQRRLTQALRALVPTAIAGQPAWDAAHPYIQAHLASHAAAAAQLDDLVTDPGFLLTASPDRLLRALPAAIRFDGQQAADVYRTALYQLRGRPRAEAASYLQLEAREYRANNLADRIDHLGLALPWSVPWARYTRAYPHLILGAHTGIVNSIAVTNLDGRPIAITTSDDATVRVWDLASGTQLHELTGHTNGVNALAVTAVDGRPVAITGGGYDDGMVRTWDLASGTQLQELPGHTRGVTAIAVTAVDGRPVAITGSGYDDGTARTWDLASGTQLQELPGHTRGVTAIAVTAVDGRPVAITGGRGGDGVVRVWDLALGTQLHELTGHTMGITALAVTALDGHPVAITGGGSGDGMVRTWDLALGTQLHELTGHTNGVNALAITALDGHPIAITGSDTDGTVRVWDLAWSTTGAEEGSDTHGPIGAVHALAVTALDGRPIAITGGGLGDGMVRVWDLALGTQLHELTGHTNGVNALAITTLDGHPVAVTGDDSTVRVWDPIEGRQLRTINIGTNVWVITPGPQDTLIVGTAMGLIALRLQMA
jgi:WD40 repeat protein